MNLPLLLPATSRLAPCALLLLTHVLLQQQACGQSRTLDVPQPAHQKVAPSPSDLSDVLLRPTDAPESAPAEIRAVSHTAPTELMFDADEDGVIWARGRGFKASFDGDHATIVPFFGSQAPQNYPIVFRANPATLDGEALLSLAPTRALRNGREVGIDRTAFVEEYELDEERLEQRFVFDSLPRRGELVVRIDVETELAISDLGDTLRFSNELGHVDYGQAFAIDAAGARIALERTYEDGVITLTVPSSFVASASLPLTIDPLVTFFTISGTSHDEFSPDISFDATTARWCAVWTDVFSAVDHDVFAKVMTASGASLGFVTVDFTTDYWTSPRIANNNTTNQFLVVAAVELQPVSSNFSSVRGRLIQAGALTIGLPFSISSNAGSTDRYLPDVGGDPQAASTFFCVVWQHTVSTSDIRIEMQLVDTTGATVGAMQVVDGLGGVNERPAISSSVGLVGTIATAERWTVTWQHEFAPIDHDIWARQVAWNGVFLSPTFNIDFSTADETEPEAATVLDPISGHRFGLIVYQRDAGADEDVMGVLIDDSAPLAPRNLSQDQPAPTVAFRQFSPKVDSDGRHFLVGHIEVDPSGFDRNLWISDYYVSAGVLVPCTVHESLAGSPATESDLALHSMASSGGPRQRYFATWAFQSISNGYDVQGGLWDGCTGGRITSYCFGDGTGTACPCGNNGATGNGCASSVNAAGAHLAGTGDANVSADTLALQASGMPATSTCLYFQGTVATSAGAGAVFGDGKRCVSGTVVRLGAKTNSAGASQYPTGGDALVSVRGLVAVGGGTRLYQAWYRNAGAFCTSSTFNLTNGLQVAWAP